MLFYSNIQIFSLSNIYFIMLLIKNSVDVIHINVALPPPAGGELSLNTSLLKLNILL